MSFSEDIIEYEKQLYQQCQDTKISISAKNSDNLSFLTLTVKLEAPKIDIKTNSSFQEFVVKLINKNAQLNVNLLSKEVRNVRYETTAAAAIRYQLIKYVCSYIEECGVIKKMYNHFASFCAKDEELDDLVNWYNYVSKSDYDKQIALKILNLIYKKYDKKTVKKLSK